MTTRIQIEIDGKRLRTQLRNYARKHGMLMKHVVKLALEEYINKDVDNVVLK